MIMIYDTTLTPYTAKAVPTWMKSENFEQLMINRRHSFLHKLYRFIR